MFGQAVQDSISPPFNGSITGVAVWVCLCCVALLTTAGCEAPDNENSEQSTAPGETELEYRVEFEETVDDADRSTMLEDIRRAALVSLEVEGITDARIDTEPPDRLTVVVPDGSDADTERVRRAVRERDRLHVAPIDHARGDSLFPRLADEAPEEIALRRIEGGHFALTHPNRDILREFFEGRVADGYRIAYLYEPGLAAHGPEVPSEIWKSYLVRDRSPLGGGHILDARLEIDETRNQPYVIVEFDDAGTQILAQLTRDNLYGRIAIAVGDTIYSASEVLQPIRDGAVGIALGPMKSFSEAQREGENLVKALRGQSVQASLELVTESDN